MTVVPWIDVVLPPMRQCFTVSTMLSRSLVRLSLCGNLNSRCYCVINVPDPKDGFDAKESSRLSKLQQKRKTVKTRELDQFGSWDLRMNFPLMEEQSIRRGTPIPQLSIDKVGFCTHQGRREYQEDRFNVHQVRQDLLFLAVWDGHGGPAASDYCSKNVERFLYRHLELEQKRLEAGNGKQDLGRVLHDVILDLNSAFERLWTSNLVGKASERTSPGTTATVVLISDNYELVVGHVGDSKAILCRDTEPRCLTKEHKPSDSSERQRIEAMGGQVTRDGNGRSRVNHRLAMSRSIGDFDLKHLGVTAQPDVSRISIKHGKDKFLVLTTDGVSDVLSNSEIIKTICQSDAPSEAAERLVDQALLFSCEDNATVLIVPFGSWGKTEDGKTSVLFSLGRNMSLTSRYN